MSGRSRKSRLKTWRGATLDSRARKYWTGADLINFILILFTFTIKKRQTIIKESSSPQGKGR